MTASLADRDRQTEIETETERDRDREKERDRETEEEEGGSLFIDFNVISTTPGNLRTEKGGRNRRGEIIVCKRGKEREREVEGGGGVEEEGETERIRGGG